MQRQETQSERTNADGCNGTDHPAVDRAGSPTPNGKRNAVHGTKQCDGRHRRGDELDDDVWDVGQHRVRDVACEADCGRADQEPPEEPDRPAVVRLGDPGWSSVATPACEVVRRVISDEKSLRLHRDLYPAFLGLASED
ncbi:MAG: hypothetical protein ACLP4W_03555 [Mycobacterium sp.]|uniref:hypothetical protein n=1 Tax=Mycobacterium sp. TaxID=1785 RepID=UPI003F99ABCA